MSDFWVGRLSLSYTKTQSSVFDLVPQERRVEKKANKMAFKEEKVRQEKQMLNLRTNVQGLKL